jgi:death-on-curing protein
MPIPNWRRGQNRGGRPAFLRPHEVLAIQARAIEAFGGLHGVRDAGALEATLTAVENRAYDEQATLTTCAATYAYQLTQAYAFLDGNKRVSAAVVEIFLELNGAALRTTDEEIVAVFLAIAAGQVSCQDVELWFAQRVVFTQEPSA